MGGKPARSGLMEIMRQESRLDQIQRHALCFEAILNFAKILGFKPK